MKLSRTCAAVVFVVSGLFETQAAQAGGAVYQRPLSNTTAGKCSPRILREQFWASGDMHGSDRSLVVACMKEGNSAEWVLLSDTSCDDPSMSPSLCDTPRARRVPEFTPDDQSIEGPGAGPQTVRYNLIKWGVGTGCTIVSTQVSSSLDTERAWLCKKVATHDGTENDSSEPKRFVVRRITTSSKEKFKDISANENATLPTAFAIVRSDEYEYKFQ